MANGTIAFDTLQTSGQITGTAKSLDTDYVVNGSAKSWVNLSQVSTQSINDSFNVSSISDGGTGLTTISYSSAMANSSYSRSTHMHRENTTANYANIDGSYNNDVFNTASLVVRTIFMNAAASGAVDSPIVSNQIFGDLA